MSKVSKKIENNKVKKFLIYFTLINFFISLVFYVNKKPKGIIGGADGLTDIMLLNGFTLNLYMIFFIIGLVSLLLLIIKSTITKNKNI